jgi:hypothetical protein
LKQIDRRTEPRVTLRIPLRIRPITGSSILEQEVESVNLSRRGLFFSTETPLEVGTRIEVLMRMPQEISGNPPTDVRCMGRVVRLQPGWLLGKAGIGVRIERYEPVATKERWAN